MSRNSNIAPDIQRVMAAFPCTKKLVSVPMLRTRFTITSAAAQRALALREWYIANAGPPPMVVEVMDEHRMSECEARFFLAMDPPA